MQTMKMTGCEYEADDFWVRILLEKYVYGIKAVILKVWEGSRYANLVESQREWWQDERTQSWLVMLTSIL